MKKLFNTTALFLMALLLLIGNAVKAQTTSFKPQDPELYKTIAQMDSVMFNAFNTKDIETMKKVFSTDLEFYHDKGGLSNYQATINSFEQVFKQVPDLKRELVKGTLEVYPVPGYGAIEMGIHRFIHQENGKPVIGLFKFVHTWRFQNNEWKATRVVSVGH